MQTTVIRIPHPHRLATTDSNVAVFALLALAAAGMMGVTLVTRKRKSKES